VLVHAAASGLGTQLGQFARSMGAGAVVGTVGSAAKLEVAKRFGYDTVVLRDEWIEGAVETPFANLIVDMVGGAGRSVSVERLPTDGRLVVVGNASGEPEPSVDTGKLFRASKTVAGFSIGELAPARPELVGQALQKAVAMLRDGRLDAGIDTVFPFDAVAEAHHAIDAGTTTGKSVLAVHRFTSS
jgi:NADPH2:quinone reductase